MKVMNIIGKYLPLILLLSSSVGDLIGEETLGAAKVLEVRNETGRQVALTLALETSSKDISGEISIESSLAPFGRYFVIEPVSVIVDSIHAAPPKANEATQKFTIKTSYGVSKGVPTRQVACAIVTITESEVGGVSTMYSFSDHLKTYSFDKYASEKNVIIMPKFDGVFLTVSTL